MFELRAVTRRMRQPEYTGENRCLPCSVANVLVAAAIAVLVDWAVSPWVGFVAFGLFLLVIYLRGYLVPGTPTITERYVPASVLGLFGKSTRTARTIEDADVVEVLAAAGGVTRRGNEVRLTDDFRTRLRDRMRAVRESGPGPERVASTLDAERVDALGRTSFVVDGTGRVSWESTAALVADVAASAELGSRLDGWETLEPTRRRDVLAGIRLLLQRCPRCDGPLSGTVDEVDPCCQPAFTVVRSRCNECGDLVVETNATGFDELAGRP